MNITFAKVDCVYLVVTLHKLFCVFIGLAITIYMRCVYGVFGREITKSTAVYGVYIQFWPTLCVYHSVY